MMKEHHLKRFMDRLMLVPRKPSAGGDETPIDHAGASLPNPKTPKGDAGIFDYDHDDENDQDQLMSPKEHAQLMDRDHLTDEHEPDGPGAEPAKHEDEENPGQSMKGLLDQKNPSKGDHAASGPMGGKLAKASSGMKPQTVMEPHGSLKEGNLSSMDHEKKVKMERARHAKIFGD